MKIKGISFGRIGMGDKRPIPGLGNDSEIYIGRTVNNSRGRGTLMVASIDFEPRGGLIIVKAVNEEGKPQRCWTQNETIKDYQIADFIAFRLAENMTMYCDDEPVSQAKR